MSNRNPTRKNSALLILLLFAQLLLMSGSVRRRNGSTVLESSALRVTAPITWVADAVSSAVRGSARRVRETFIARSENVHLRAEVRRLSAQVTRMREESLENRRLRRLLSMHEYLAPEAIAASVVSANLTGQTRMLVIDRGRNDGVDVDQAVVAWGGAVGRVIYADGAFAKVRLLSDPNSGVAAVIQRSRAEGMVFGQGDDPLDMVYVSKYSDVVLGDQVVTSGRDGVFPRGFSIGRVTFAASAGEVSKTIRLQRAVDFRDLEEVLVLSEPGGGGLLPPPEIETTR